MNTGRLLDADTIRLPGVGSVRFEGIDAPERGQPARLRFRRIDAGAFAARALARHVEVRTRKGWRLRVRGAGRGKYGRILGTITLEHRDGRTEDVGAWLVGGQLRAPARLPASDAGRRAQGLLLALEGVGDLHHPRPARAGATVGGGAMAKHYTFEEIEAVRADWERVFGEPITWGFEITEPQIPIMHECIRLRSKAPLAAYIASIPEQVCY